MCHKEANVKVIRISLYQRVKERSRSFSLDQQTYSGHPEEISVYSDTADVGTWCEHETKLCGWSTHTHTHIAGTSSYTSQNLELVMFSVTACLLTFVMQSLLHWCISVDCLMKEAHHLSHVFIHADFMSFCLFGSLLANRGIEICPQMEVFSCRYEVTAAVKHEIRTFTVCCLSLMMKSDESQQTTGATSSQVSAAVASLWAWKWMVVTSLSY